ncbi:MAG: ankyrin repeat domain-containing protein [Bryobacteraceae bacterium]|nr:ankyrin repeat domain-containing protein [Bryobacteraceae bacterium]
MLYSCAMGMMEQITDGRTDLVFEYLAAGHTADSADSDGVALIRWCAYYGDVSAIRFLLAGGESLRSLGDNFDLNGACYHGHWRLCQFLIERGADVNRPLPDSGETPLHAAICKADRPAYNMVVKVLLAAGANPNAVAAVGRETGGFMRDCRTKGETPLHRAAAFGDETMIRLLLEAGAKTDVRDANGDTPLTWASWYLRPAPVLRLLCFGPHRVHPDYAGMDANLLGRPHL